MKLRRMVMLVWLAVAFLLIGLCQQEILSAVNVQPRAVFSLHPFLEPTQPPPPTALDAKAPVPDGARAEPLEPFADHGLLLSERHVGPPTWETRGPPHRVQRSFVNGWAASEAGSPKPQNQAQSLRKCASD
jgi:hypothetical protein